MTAGRVASITAAAELLGEGVTEDHVRARLLRGTLDAKRGDNGSWQVSLDSIERSLRSAPTCGGCGRRAAEVVIVKYPQHERVEFELCKEHAAQAALAYGRQGQVLEVVTYPYQSEGWVRPRPLQAN